MKKLFISQPMNGKTDSEIMIQRRIALMKAEKELNEPIELIDSFIADAPENATPLWYLAKSLEFLSQADIAYFAPGWKSARGCVIEHDCASKYGIKVIEG